MTDYCIQQEAICYQWFKQRLILSVSLNPVLVNGHRLKKSPITIKPSVPAREFNFKAYATITWNNDLASLGLKPRLASHLSQAAHTAMLPIVPPGQAVQTIFRQDNSISGWVIITSILEKQLSAIVEFFWWWCRPHHHCLHFSLQWSTKFHPNRTTLGKVLISYQLQIAATCSGAVFQIGWCRRLHKISLYANQIPLR